MDLHWYTDTSSSSIPERSYFYLKHFCFKYVSCLKQNFNIQKSQYLLARDRNSRKESLIPTAITLSHAPVRTPRGKGSETKATNHDTVLSSGSLPPVPVCLCSEYSCEGVFLLYPSKRWTCGRETAGTVLGRFPGEFRSMLDSGNGCRVFSWAGHCPQRSLPVPCATALAPSSSSQHSARQDELLRASWDFVLYTA